MHISDHNYSVCIYKKERNVIICWICKCKNIVTYDRKSDSIFLSLIKKKFILKCFEFLLRCELKEILLQPFFLLPKRTHFAQNTTTKNSPTKRFS